MITWLDLFIIMGSLFMLGGVFNHVVAKREEQDERASAAERTP
jgi:hypothetical protein